MRKLVKFVNSHENLNKTHKDADIVKVRVNYSAKWLINIDHFFQLYK